MQNSKHKKASRKLTSPPGYRKVSENSKETPEAKKCVEETCQATECDRKPVESVICLASRAWVSKPPSLAARTSLAASPPVLCSIYPLASGTTDQGNHLAVRDEAQVEKQQEEGKRQQSKKQEEGKRQQPKKQEGRQWESLALLPGRERLALLPGRDRRRLIEQLRLTI